MIKTIAQFEKALNAAGIEYKMTTKQISLRYKGTASMAEIHRGVSRNAFNQVDRVRRAEVPAIEVNGQLIALKKFQRKGRKNSLVNRRFAAILARLTA